MAHVVEFSTVIVHLGGYFFIVFVSICIATGLYYIAELIEEHTRLTKNIIKISIQVTLFLHLLVLLFDRLPLMWIATGVAAQMSYWRLLKHFPFIPLTDVDFLISLGLLAVNQAGWMYYFYHTHHTIEYILSFFELMVWVVPFTILLSLAAYDPSLTLPEVDPHRGWDHAAPEPGAPRRGGKGTRSLLLVAFDALRRKKDEVLPMVSSSTYPLRKDHTH